MGMLMSVIMMWLGMAAFFFALIFINSVKTQAQYLQKLGKEPDAKYKNLNITAKVLFALGLSLWIFGAILTMATGGK